MTITAPGRHRGGGGDGEPLGDPRRKFHHGVPFTYSDPFGSPAAQYDFWDTGAGGGASRCPWSRYRRTLKTLRPMIKKSRAHDVHCRHRQHWATETSTLGGEASVGLEAEGSRP